MTDIVFVLDESTSMSPYRQKYIDGINSFITTQKHFNPSALFTLVKFNSVANVLCTDEKITNLPMFTPSHYNPNGMTALYDAIGSAMDARCQNRLRKTVMIILTDGADNESRFYSLDTIRERVNYFRSIGWTFVFIAANQQAEQIGKQMGIDTCITYNSNTKSIERVVEACNIVVGHTISKWTGKHNVYSRQTLPTDVREMMDTFENMHI